MMRVLCWSAIVSYLYEFDWPLNLYSGTSLIRTPEMRTPRFNGHFAQVRNLSHSLLYIFTSEMRTPRYSV